MMQYTVKFLDKAGKQYEKEEVLYIMEELTPVHRNWKRDICTDGVCLFTYHNAEHCTVSYSWDNSNIITVIDY